MFERGGNSGNLLVGLRPLLLLDGLADAGDGFYAVSGVEARRVEQMLEPRPIGQSALIGQQTLAANRIQELQQQRPQSARTHPCKNSTEKESSS